MQEQGKKEKKPINAAEKIRRILFNFDLELTASLGELSLAKARVQRYADKKNRKELEIYTSACIDEAKLNVYIDHHKTTIKHLLHIYYGYHTKVHENKEGSFS